MNNQKRGAKFISHLRLLKLFLCVSVMAVYSFTSHRTSAFSSGPPPGQTGAPGETTCVSCHFSFPINSGSGTFAITGLPATYTSAQEVDITITLTQSNRLRYGFQVTALTDSGAPAGTLIVTDASRTQLIQGGGGRTYIEHTGNGVAPSATNQGSWSFRWRAPASSAGRITFYAAGNAANGNFSSDGDFIYTATAVTQPAAQPSPAITNLNPSSATAGGPSFSLIVTGANFGAGSIVRWNNADRPTTVDSATQLTASIPATDIAVAGTSNVTVVNPDEISSNSLVFTITVAGLEADVAPRGNPNGVVSISDWVQVGRFAAGLDVAAEGIEFQRADCSPIATRGNGVISIADWVQAGRYATGLDPVVSASGPSGPNSDSDTASNVGSPVASLTHLPEPVNAARSIVRATPVLDRSTRSFSFIIQIETPGDAHALGFSLNFDPTRLRFAGASSSAELSRATFLVNSEHSEDGLIGIMLTLPAGQSMSKGVRSLMSIHFVSVAVGAQSDANIGFGDYPVAREIVDTEAHILPAAFEKPKTSRKLLRTIRKRGEDQTGKW